MRPSICCIAIAACLLAGCDTEYDTETRALSTDGGSLPGASGSPVSVGGSSGSADLLMVDDSRSELQSSYAPGDTIVYAISIRNAGSEDVTDSFTISWSDDQSNGAPATVTDDIPAGETVQLDLALTYELGEADVGDRVITFVVDSSDVIDESNENNNTTTYSFTVSGGSS